MKSVVLVAQYTCARVDLAEYRNQGIFSSDCCVSLKKRCYFLGENSRLFEIVGWNSSSCRPPLQKSGVVTSGRPLLHVVKNPTCAGLVTHV